MVENVKLYLSEYIKTYQAHLPLTIEKFVREEVIKEIDFQTNKNATLRFPENQKSAIQ